MAQMSQAQLDAAWEQYQAQESQPQPSAVQAAQPANNADMEAAWQAYQAQQQPQLQQPGNNMKNFAGYVGNQVKSAVLGAAQPFIDTAAYVQDQVQKPFNALTGAKPYDVNMNVTQYAPDQTTAILSGLGSSFALPGGAILKGMKSFGGQLAAGAGLGAAYGNVFGDPSRGVVENSVMGAALPVALTSLGRAVPAFFKSRLDKIEENSKENPNIRTPEQAKAILDAQNTLGIKGAPAQVIPDNIFEIAKQMKDKILPFGVPAQEGLPLSIGNLTNSPGLKSYYDWGSKAPLASQQKNIHAVGDKVDAAGNDVYNRIINGVDPSAENIIKQVQSKAKEIKGNTKTAYDTLFKNADDAGITNIQTPDLQTVSKSLIDQLSFDKKQGLPHYLDSNEAKPVVQLLKKYMNPFSLASGRPTVPGMKDVNPSNTGGLKSLKEVRTQISDVGNRLDKKSPLYGSLMQVIDRLKKGVNEDIGYNIGKSDNPALKKQWDDVNADYVKNNVPLKKVSDIIRGDKKGNSAVNKLLSEPDVLNLLDSKTRELIGARKLINSVKDVSRDEFGNTKMNVNASRLTMGNNKMDIKEKNLMNSLFSPNTQKNLDALSKLNEVAVKYRSMANPPENGAKLASLLTKGGLAGAASMAALKPGLVSKAVSGTLGGLGLNKAILKVLTNPVLLKAYANPAQRTEMLRSLTINPQINPAGLAYIANQ